MCDMSKYMVVLFRHTPAWQQARWLARLDFEDSSVYPYAPQRAPAAFALPQALNTSAYVSLRQPTSSYVSVPIQDMCTHAA